MTNSENLEIDQTRNPFIAIFPEAVEFKIRYAMAAAFDASQIISEIEHRKHCLEDNEIEIFLYPAEKNLVRANSIFQQIAEITAILAFAPGGIDMFGWHFEVSESEFRIGKIQGYQWGREKETRWKLQERRIIGR